MSLAIKIFGGGDQVRKEAFHQEESEKFPEESLMRKREVLVKKIDQELLLAKKNSRNSRQVALQALRRKKWYQKRLKDIDCAVKAMGSAHEHILGEAVNKVNELIKDIAEEQEGTQDMPDTVHTSMCFEMEFDEDELLAELERLEENVDESLFELDRVEERVSCPKVSSTASPSYPAKTEEDEIEEDLEYLRRWLNEPS
ncbi:charged multivesicular body protein 4b-like [Chaetodon auriga]|uniref:charged multivesicular body protein 4b-like n=1 Tax=Chaetodon auriga TaxID=39042 RepID=UPI004032E177